VLDSTDPAQVKAVEGKVKSREDVGSSFPANPAAPPTEHLQTIFLRPREERGWRKASEHFVAITDPGSKMQKVAEGDRFRHIFFGDPTIAGDTPRSLISAWFQRLLWEWTRRSFSTRPRRWCMPALQACRLKRIRRASGNVLGVLGKRRPTR